MAKLARRRVWLDVGLAVVLVAAGVGVWLAIRGTGSSDANTSTGPTTQVRTGTVNKTVSAAGNVELADQTAVPFAAGGTVTRVDVKVGDTVKKGERLGTLDPSDAQQAVADAQDSLDLAKGQVSVADAGVTSAESSRTAANAQLDNAIQNKDDWESSGGSSGTTANSGSGSGSGSGGSGSGSGGSGSGSGSGAQTEQSLDAAIDQARSQVDSADQQVLSAKQQRTQAYQNVDSAERTLAARQADLAETTLKSPVSGTVVEVDHAVGDSVGGSSSSTGSGSSSGAGAGSGSGSGSGTGAGSGGSAGSGSSNGTTGSSSSAGSGSSSSSTGSATLAVIADLGKLEVQASFTEADIVSVKVGQSVTVTPNAQSDKAYKGKVASIDPLASTSNNVVTYGVTIDFDASAKALRPGQTVSASVLVDHADNALYLPASAVRGTGQSATVERLQGSERVRTVVQVGLRGDQYVQITSGLKDGDVVALSGTTGQNQQSSNQQGTGGFPGSGGNGGGFPGGSGAGGGGNARTFRGGAG